MEGKLVAGEQMGRIEGPHNEADDDCITVALPPNLAGDFDAVPVRASGKVYKMPDFPFIEYKLRDRWVDAEACHSGLAMYVDKLEVLR